MHLLLEPLLPWLYLLWSQIQHETSSIGWQRTKMSNGFIFIIYLFMEEVWLLTHRTVTESWVHNMHIALCHDARVEQISTWASSMHHIGANLNLNYVTLCAYCELTSIGCLQYIISTYNNKDTVLCINVFLYATFFETSITFFKSHEATISQLLQMLLIKRNLWYVIYWLS